ncbi:germination protein, Ger(x)C family [Paenibacillus sp. 1_12]|uniref:Ger(x)C family spore germination protein n=1 Tax=Paenibacillus sp. 1_12 TaxID=1566278 RepID=UPI0008E0D221|nr:Ger(x)C family spore germination protein [Paenibacillus sp. 1_12]SFL98962.1 germination protein, Ger(x)C family [Paenibacillus sp. 1_12]
MKLKSLVRLTLLCCCATLLSGCWNHKDINKRYLPVVIAITEGQKEKYKVILRIPDPMGKKLRVIESEAQSIAKSFDKMRTKADVDIDLMHLKLILFSESIAKKGIKDIVEYAIRSRDIPPKILVASVKGDLEPLMHDQRTSNVGATEYDFFSKQAGWTPNISIVPLWKAFRSINSDLEDIAIPIISKGKDTLFDFHGSAMMRDGRMLEMVSTDEMFIYNLFEGSFGGGILEVMNAASVTVVKASISNQADWKSGPSLRSRMKLDVVIEEKSEGMSNDEIKNKLVKIVGDRYNRLLKKTQAHQVDILGLGLCFSSHMSEQQRSHWRDEWLPKLKYQFTVDINIQDTGNLQ